MYTSDEIQQAAPRVWAKVQRAEGCWPWKGGRCGFRQVYGRTSIRGKTVTAHRLVYQLIHGPISDDLEVCHHCDNPICCNPDHLFLGTAKDNAIDSSIKGRRSKKSRGMFLGKPSRLTPEIVLAAREWYAKRGLYRSEKTGDSMSRMAASLGVGLKVLSRAIHGETWGYLPHAVPVVPPKSR